MSLIRCPECGKENVSSFATACPNCGFNISASQQNAEQTDQGYNQQPVVQQTDQGYYQQPVLQEQNFQGYHNYQETDIRQYPYRSVRDIRYNQPNNNSYAYSMLCPMCGSQNISSQVFQENRGSHTYTNTTSKYKEKGHGCLWWLLIGWWWWIVDLLLWIFLFFPRLILRLFSSPYKKKKYTGSSTSNSRTVNDITYRTVYRCQNCGNTWS